MDESRIIDYLYGELSDHEMHQFELQMKDNPKLLQEVKEMREVQSVLRSDLDVQPSADIHLFEPSPRPGRWMDSRWWMAAASLLLLLLVARAADLNLVVGEGQVALRLGQDADQEPLDRQEILNLLANEFDSYEMQMENRLQQLEAKLVQNVQVQSDPQWETRFAGYREEFSELQQDLRKDQITRYGQFVDQMQRDRRNYSRELMEDLFRYVEEQRRQDLEAINQGFLQLSQAIQGDDASTRFVNQPIKKY